MVEMWRPLTIEIYKDWIEAILDEASDELNDWESTFIESIYTRLHNGNNLTQPQAEKLESIYVAKTK